VNVNARNLHPRILRLNGAGDRPPDRKIVAASVQQLAGRLAENALGFGHDDAETIIALRRNLGVVIGHLDRILGLQP
jgi:hypothetical protein